MARASINPTGGPVGTTFYFNATNLVVGEEVTVSVTDSQNRRQLFRTVIADENGSIGYAQISLSTNGLPAGSYNFVVKRKEHSNIQAQFRVF